MIRVIGNILGNYKFSSLFYIIDHGPIFIEFNSKMKLVEQLI